MTQVLCFGSAGKDIFFPTSEGETIETPGDILSQKKIAFELGTKVKIEKRYESLGGCAANAAAGLARLGVASGCISSIGDDASGKWVMSELKKCGVKTDLMQIEKGNMTDLSAIIVDEASADRVIFTNKNSSGKLKFNAKKMAEADWFFISDIHGKWEDQMELLFEMAKKGGKKVAFNPREAGIHEDPAEIIEAIGLCEIVFVNKDEAIEIVSNMKTGEFSEKLNDELFLLEKIKSLEPEIVVLTDGERGAWVADGKETLWAPSRKISAKDSTGAGDAFASGFLAAKVKNEALEECLKWGIANSASAVEHYGAIEGLLFEKDILKKMEDVKTKDIALQKMDDLGAAEETVSAKIDENTPLNLI